MNITELARQLKVSTQELRDTLPKLGFDIGQRAIKVDERVAEQIVKKWNEARRGPAPLAAAAGAPVGSEEAHPAPAPTKIPLPGVITVRDFASKLRLPVTRVIGELMKNGILASLNERIDFETAAIVAEDLGFAVSKEEEKEEVSPVAATLEERLKALMEESPESLVPRPPVVVVMGHVDHGKTKLLDAIRLTDVAAAEAGGITQHIGAYQVEKKGRRITFIDTPGHEAFTVMRSRGARVADVAILVVAADDGVQPQTVEAFKIIQAAKLPLVVALNKIDKSDANPEKVKSQLSDIGLIPEEWGGKTVIVPVSAKTNQGLDNLLETILLVADLDKEKIVANPNRRALGTVIESHVDRGEGAVATVLVQTGTLKKNDLIAVGGVLYGRVRAMKDYRGVLTEGAPPGTPVKVLGFKNAPLVGDVLEAPDAKAAKEMDKVKTSAKTPETQVTIARLESTEEKEKKILPVILKTDVLGSFEAIAGSLEKFIHPEIGVKIIGKGLGNITEAEILSAEAAGAIVYGFNVQVTPSAAELARDKGVEARLYKIIYDLLDNVKDELEKILSPEKIRTVFGKAKVLAIFRSEKDNQIVGGVVIDGKVSLNAKVRVMRGELFVGEGTITELQSGKRAVPEVFMGQEFGVKIRGKFALAPNDLLEIYSEEVKKRGVVF